MSGDRGFAGEAGADARVHAAEGPEGLEHRVADRRLLELSRRELSPPPEDDEELGDAGSLLRPSRRRRKKKDKGLPGEVSALSVFGEDDREEIDDTGAYPWRAVCWLRIEWPDGVREVGTGWLAAPRLVVTAGHCVHQRNHGGWAVSIEVAPGRDGGASPHGTFVSGVLRSVTGWVDDRRPSLDYGAVLLRGGAAPGDSTGWFGYTAASTASLRSKTLNLAGYPDDKSPGTLWWQARRVERVRSDSLGYTIDTEGGQSGAPLWWKADSGRQVVAIHTGGLGGLNHAVRIGQGVLNNLSAWRRQAAG